MKRPSETNTKGYTPKPAYNFDVVDPPTGPHLLRDVWALHPMGTWAWVITEYYHATVNLVDGKWKVDRTPTIMSSAFGEPGARFAFPDRLADEVETHLNRFGMPGEDSAGRPDALGLPDPVDGRREATGPVWTDEHLDELTEALRLTSMPEAMIARVTDHLLVQAPAARKRVSPKISP